MNWTYDDIKHALQAVPHPHVLFERPSTGECMSYQFPPVGPLGILLSELPIPSSRSSRHQTERASGIEMKIDISTARA